MESMLKSREGSSARKSSIQLFTSVTKIKKADPKRVMPFPQLLKTINTIYGFILQCKIKQSTFSLKIPIFAFFIQMYPDNILFQKKFLMFYHSLLHFQHR